MPACVVLALLLVACRESQEPGFVIPGADVENGRSLVSAAGCGACHVIPGVSGARGQVGPPLTNFARRAYIGGQLRNEPAALAAWVRDAPAFDSATAMPPTPLTDAEARDVAAFLYTVGDAQPLGPARLFPGRWVESW